MKTELVFLGKHINIASRARRRWLVVFIHAGFAALVTAWFFVCGDSAFFLPGHRRETMLTVLFMLASSQMIMFLGGRSYNGGLLPPFDSGDERELHRRDHAYYVAYKWWDLALLPPLFAVGLKINPFYPGWDPAVRIFVDRLPYALLVAAGILYYTLPQAMLLWTEPDMEEPK